MEGGGGIKNKDLGNQGCHVIQTKKSSTYLFSFFFSQGLGIRQWSALTGFYNMHSDSVTILLLLGKDN